MKIEITNAFNGKHLKSIEQHSLTDAEKMLEDAHNTFYAKDKWLKHHERVAILNKLYTLMQSEANEFAMLIAKEGGKPLTDAKVEVARAIDGIKVACEELMNTFKGQEIPMGFTKASENRLSFKIYEPIGVVLAISAFNHPLNLAIHQVIPAVAVGCPVIIKPASKTPSCTMKLVELLHKAGLPKEWCQYVICDNKTAEFMVSSEKIAFFTFIGSAKVGWNLRNKLANGTRYALEHGGVAPVIIDKHLDSLESIITPIVKGAFYHGGQVCISTQRIFVPKELEKEFSKKLVAAVKKLKVGDPTLADTEVGPLIATKEVDRVHTWIENAKKEGATLLCGGKKITDTCYQPTVLLNPSLESQVSTEEVFGPLVCIYTYDDINQAIKIANSTNLPFQAAIFSNNLGNIMKLFYNIESAGIIVNDSSAFRVDWMPFGARKAAGYGIGGIGYAMHDMVTYKLLVIKDQNIPN